MSLPIPPSPERSTVPARTRADRKTRAESAASRWDVANEVELLKDIFRRDFWSFFLYCYGAGVNPKGTKWIEYSVHEPLARWFQHHVDEWMEKRRQGIVEQKHLAVLVHREVGKTTMVTQAGQAWLHLRDPELSSYTGSESLQLAMKIVGGIKAIMEDSDPYALFGKLYGNWASDSRVWTAKEVVHSARRNTSKKDPSLGTFAVETSIVGAHPDAIFYDDPISYERMSSDSNWLQTVNQQVTSLFPVIQSDGLVVWVGTRYDDQDHFGIAFRDEGVVSLSGMKTDSIKLDPEGKWHVYFMAGRDDDGKPTTPKVWPERRLSDFQRRDPLRYAAQVMNDPALSEFNPITKDQVNQCYIDAKDVPWGALKYSFCTDIAFADGEKRIAKDETVIVVHGHTVNGSGDVFVVEVVGSPLWRQEDFGNTLVAMVQRYRRQGKRIKGISGETARSGLKGALRQLLANYFADANLPMPPYFEFERGSTKKETRLVNAAGYWVDGHVRLVRGAPGIEKLADQMVKIGQYMVNKRTPIDYADAHSDAFQPEFYQRMQASGQKAPYERGSIPLNMDNLDTSEWDDSPYNDWISQVPREPIRS
jgi:hypothetical protein